jgi:signal transduction histidine kinase
LPPGHPQLHSFLGTKLCANGRTVGFTYAGSVDPGSSFTAEDEELAHHVGTGLGEAIGSVQLLRDALKARRWMRAVTSMTRDLLSPELDEPLRLISDRAQELSEADLVALMLVTEDERMKIRYARGLHSESELVGYEFSLADSGWVRRVLHSNRGQVVPSLPLVERGGFRAMTGLDLGPAMLLPLHGHDSAFGALFLGRLSESSRFTETDMEIAGAFARHAAIMLELAAAREVSEKVQRLEDRNRIGRDLHDHVIQRLYGTGMSLQGLTYQADGDVRDRLENAVAALDDTITQIRTTIMSLRSTDAHVTLEQLVTDIAREATPLLGFEPLVALEVPSGEVSGPLAADLAACVREGLSNVVRHAAASQVEVRATVDSGGLHLTLIDDGVGIQSNRRSGLGNLAERVAEHGGTFQVTSAPGLGTALTWVVPFPRQRGPSD